MNRRRAAFGSLRSGSLLRLLCTVLLFGACFLSQTWAINDVVVKNLKLFVDGTEFIVKGVCYHPEPLGMMTDGGLCTPRAHPLGYLRNACYDQDFFDGTVRPDGPPEGWFTSLWRRDFPLMREAGVNTIRVYHPSYLTGAVVAANRGRYGITSEYGFDHVPFFNLAHEWDLKIIWSLGYDYSLLSWAMQGGANEDAYKEFLRWQIDEVGGHPALLMYMFMNEIPLDNITGLNYWMQFIREYQQERHQRTIPVSHAVVDDPRTYEELARDLDVDVFTANAGYRGYDFSDFWSGGTPSSFRGWATLSCEHDLPVLIGEFGWWGINNTQNEQNPLWVQSKWRDLVRHIDAGCIGGLVYSWQDEPRKAAIDQRTMGMTFYSENHCGEQSSLQRGALFPDQVRRKPIVFEALRSGTIDGEAWNFNVDVFEKLGRAPACLWMPSSKVHPCMTGGRVDTTGSNCRVQMQGPPYPWPRSWPRPYPDPALCPGYNDTVEDPTTTAATIGGPTNSQHTTIGIGPMGSTTATGGSTTTTTNHGNGNTLSGTPAATTWLTGEDSSGSNSGYQSSAASLVASLAIILLLQALIF